MALKNGSRGDDVAALQQQLIANGYDISADGIFGPKTEAAVRDYQAKNNLSVDGIVGTQTSTALNAAPAAEPTQNVTLGTQKSTVRPQSSFETSERTNRYQSLLDDNEMNKPDAYQSQYSGQIDNIVNLILNREKFDVNTDANYKSLYDSYAPMYRKQAERSMKDAMGASAGLTGGYASSYAQAAGQQAYDATMDQLNARKMELANLAYQMYQDKNNDLYNQLNMYQGLENEAYGRYRDDYSDWANERNYLSGLYDQSYANDRAEWEADRDYTDSVFESAMALAQAGYDVPDSYMRWLDDDQLADLNAARTYSQAAPSHSGGSGRGPASRDDGTDEDEYVPTRQDYYQLLDNMYDSDVSATSKEWATLAKEMEDKFPGAYTYYRLSRGIVA